MHYARNKKCYSVSTTFELSLDHMYIDLLLKAQHAGALLNHRFPKFLSPQTYAKNQHAECMLETCTSMQWHNPTKQVIKSSIWRCQGSASLLKHQLPPPMLHGDPSRVLVVHVVLPERLPQTSIYVVCPRPRIAARNTLLVRTLTTVRTPVLLIAACITIYKYM